MNMVCATCYIPKDDERKPGGEDAHFIYAEQQMIGVADGVGGWAKYGVDAGEYARELIFNSIIAVHRERSNSRGGLVDPKRVLEYAFSKTKLRGSSTACILAHSDGVLRAVNVGDSGFMVFRDNKCVFRSKIQQRGFNRPYQLGKSSKLDRPDCAAELEVAVMVGDVVVLGTDGLLDNVFPWEIEEVLKEESEAKEGIKPDKLACSIAGLSLNNSMDKFKDSPFSEAAKKAGKTHSGGKVDDITVIVGHIVDKC
ncbi:PPM-type phosphatase domain containing protein, partial [Trema orientale]